MFLSYRPKTIALRFCSLSLALLSLALSVTVRGADDLTNTKFGDSAFSSNTTGRYDTAIGYNVLSFNTTGSDNTGVGAYCLYRNKAGNSNTAIGQYALGTNNTGNSNTAVGSFALVFNESGVDNTATGFEALRSNKANFNTADGQGALHQNTDGEINTASGVRALFSNTKGNNNSAHGGQALLFSTTGNNNTADGASAMLKNTNGNRNTALGWQALSENTTGDNNIAIGAEAGSNLTVGNNNIVIGTAGVAGDSNSIRIGKPNPQTRTFIQGIYGSPVSGGQQVVVNSAGKLGVVTPSSARFKEQIKPMAETSESILALEPVTFRYKPDMNADEIPQFGLVAEEVEKVNPNLVVRDEDGKLSGVRYEAVNAMLLNEFLKEHRKVEELKAQQQRSAALATQQQQQIDALTAGLQRVNEKVQSGPSASVEPSSQH